MENNNAVIYRLKNIIADYDRKIKQTQVMIEKEKMAGRDIGVTWSALHIQISEYIGFRKELLHVLGDES